MILLFLMQQATLNTLAQKLIPEWKTPKGIAIVYPDKLPDNRKKLVRFYDSFIQIILNNTNIKELTIIHRHGLKELLSKKFTDQRINLIESAQVQDIWIRDWGAIASTSDKVIKAYYSPAYFAEHEKKYSDKDDQTGFELFQKLDLKSDSIVCQNQKLILDGGNFIHNGNGIGITTNRIIADNESLSIDQIREAFKEQLGIKKLIIVPVEPGDVTGHIDGMVRFKDENTVFVGGYPDDYPYKSFMDSMANQLQKDFKVIRIINATPKDEETNGIPSAYGNYINYLRIGDIIFLPQYGGKLQEKDNAARQEYEKYFKVIPVDNDIGKLSELGGVLNCITWTYY